MSQVRDTIGDPLDWSEKHVPHNYDHTAARKLRDHRRSVYQRVGDVLKAANIAPEVSDLSRVPRNTVDLDAANVRKVLKMTEQLDDHDDVQSVSANFNIPDEVMAAIGEEG